MAGINSDSDRQILPRWRPFAVTASLAELASGRPSREFTYDSGFLDSRKYDWRVHRTVGHAADLVGTALTVGRETDAIDAASYLLNNVASVSPWLRTAAESVLGLHRMKGDASKHIQAQGKDILRATVRLCRHALREEPRDPIMCVDLARAYISLGLREKATQYMDMAVAMAPDNRFVLRSSCRLSVHLGDSEKAHETICRSQRTRHDPWLIAAEIATSGALNRAPRLSKVARVMIANRDYPLGHLSELASGLATLELESGGIKKSRKLFDLSLAMPTENSVAQAAWASRRDSRIRVSKHHLARPDTFEARSWTYFLKDKWGRVVEECNNWSSDQPFSSRPNILGSYVAALALEDYSQCERFAEDALVVDPNDFILLNNLAFAHINMNKFSEAKRSIDKMVRISTGQRERAVRLATLGLFAFRTGRSEEGRQYYSDALEAAKRERNDVLYGSALAFFAAESWRAGVDDRQIVVSKARSALQRTDSPESRLVKRMLDRKLAFGGCKVGAPTTGSGFHQR